MLSSFVDLVDVEARPAEPGLEASTVVSWDRCRFIWCGGGVLIVKDCGMIFVISAIVAASETGESARLRLVDRGGNEEGLVGRVAGLAFALDRFPELWIWRRFSSDGRLEVLGVAVEDSSVE